MRSGFSYKVKSPAKKDVKLAYEEIDSKEISVGKALFPSEDLFKNTESLNSQTKTPSNESIRSTRLQKRLRLEDENKSGFVANLGLGDEDEDIELNSPVRRGRRSKTPSKSSQEPNEGRSLGPGTPTSDIRSRKTRKSSNTQTIPATSTTTSKPTLKDNDKIPKRRAKEESTRVIPRSYYPRIPFDPKEVCVAAIERAKSSGDSELSHKSILSNMIKVIFEKENEGLIFHFQTLNDEISKLNKGGDNDKNNNDDEGDDNGDLIAANKALLTSLQSVLNETQALISDSCDEESEFLPELTSANKSQLMKMQETLSILEGHHNAMTTYLSNIQNSHPEVIDEHSLSQEMGRAEAEGLVAPELVQISHESLDGFISSFMRNFSESVDRISAKSAGLGAVTEEARGLISQSRKLQFALYDNFNKVRFKSHSTEASSMDPKQLIRELQSAK